MIEAFGYKWTASMEGGRIIHPDEPWMWYDHESVSAENGTAELIARDERRTVKFYDGRVFKPTVSCGVMRSAEMFGYGTFSAEIQLPKGKNLWPSFWLVGDGHWPDNGEIDIMEAWSNGKGSYYRFPLGWRTTTNIHYLEGVHKQIGSKNISVLKQPKNPSGQFIRYEVEWRLNIVTFRVNGKTVRECGWDIAQHLLGKRMHIVFNLWTDSEDFTCETPMKIKNFEYKPIEVL